MIGLAIIVFLIAINGLFVAMEFVIVGSRLSRLESLSDRGKGIAESLDGVEAKDRYVAVAQLGITLASIGLGMYGEHRIALWLEAPLASAGIEGAGVHVVSLVLAIVVMTYFHVVFGEMIPKALALKGAERLLVLMWPVIRFFEVLLRPLVWLLNIVSQALLSLFNLDRSEARYHTPRELAAIAEDSSEGGAISIEQAAFIRNIVSLQGRRAHELMTPRRRVICLDLDREGEGDLAPAILQKGPSRLPVIRGDLGNSLGVIHVKDVIGHEFETDEPLDAEALQKLLRPLPAIMAGVDTGALLDNMRRNGTHMALVKDERGSILGTVAFEDVIEEVVGDIETGFEVDDETEGEERCGRRWKLRGTLPLSRLRAEHGWEFGDTRSRTIGGLVTEHLQRPPQVGDTCEVGGLTIRVGAVDGLAIEDVFVDDPGEEGAASDDTASSEG